MRVRVLIMAAAIAAALAPLRVDAQTPSAAAQAPPAAPAPKFTGTATTSVSLETGRTDLSGISVDLTGKRTYKADGEIGVSFNYAHATTDPPGETGRTTVANRLTATFDVAHNFGERVVAVARVQALRDPVSRIDYRIGEMAGLGLRLANTRSSFRFVPGIAFLNDDKNVVSEPGFHVHYGLFQDLATKLTPEWTFTQLLLATRDFANPRDYVLTFDARLTGAITKLIGIQLSYRYDYERILPPGINPKYQKTAAGVQLRF